MADMLVPLYSLPDKARAVAALSVKGITIHRAMAHQRSDVLRWVEQQFGRQWADESRLAFKGHPIGCYVAVCNAQICGFACINCTYLGFFGPFGVEGQFRGRGIGRVLLLEGLSGLRSLGYAYAIIGCVADPAFFEHTIAATVIHDSSPGPYFHLSSLKKRFECS